MLISGDDAAQLRRQTSGATVHTAQQSGEDRDLSSLLVSNEGNFRNLQVERDQSQGHYQVTESNPDGAIHD